MRSWNLSALWRIRTDGGLVWLKAVPDFFAHEGAVIDWLGTPVAPRLIDHAPGRVLIANIPGAANHDLQDLAVLRPMVAMLTSLQERAVVDLDALTAVGVPDRRLPSMLPPIARVVEEWGDRLVPVEAARPRRCSSTVSRSDWAPSPSAACRTPWCTGTSTPATSPATRITR